VTSPRLTHATLQLLPLAFDLIPIHSRSLLDRIGDDVVVTVIEEESKVCTSMEP
jgi:hypothetical protein